MRLPLILTTAALALSGCVIQNPGMAPAPMPLPQVTPAPDAAIRSSARVVVNREMAKRLPGRNVAPYTDCVVNNASMAEVADIAARGVNDTTSAASSVAVIVQRPEPTQCFAKVAATA